MNNTSPISENKMGYMPVGKLLVSMALPMILSMLVQALYNVVDSIFVAQINENALTAVSLAFPVQNLMIAFSSGTGVGLNALLSRSLGEKNFDRADKAANTGILLNLITCIGFALFGLFFSKFYYSVQTQDAEIIAYGQQYLSIVCIFSFGLFTQITMERLMQSTGKTFYAMITQGLGAIINIVLDPILIFGYFGFPRMGAAGAAAATVIGQIIAMLLGVYMNMTRNQEIHIGGHHLRLHGPTAAAIYQVGIPSIIMMSIGSVMTFGMNKILLMFSSTAAAVFGVYFKLQSFFFMPVFGLNNGMVPIVAYNLGAKNKQRIMKTIKLSIGAATFMMIIGLITFQLIPDLLLELFNASDEMLEIGCAALRTISWSYIFAGFCIVAGSVFQALGNGVYSLIVSVFRQLLVILPVSYFLAVSFGLTVVWWAFPIAELVSLTLSLILLFRIYREKIAVLEE